MSFGGFPRRVRHTPVPNPMFGTLLEEIDDLGELKATLRVIWLLQQKRGFPRVATLTELAADPVMVNSVVGDSPDPKAAVAGVLAAAVGRGTLATAKVEQDGGEEHIYILNTEGNRKVLEDFTPDSSLADVQPYEAAAERPNIFALYENNIGMLSPIIAEQLKEAEETYPQDWIEEAFREAVGRNVRNWRYIAAILERWATEGRDDDARAGRYPQKDARAERLRR